MGRFSDTLLSGFQTGWGMAEGVRDNRNRADQQAFDNNMAVQNQQQEEAWRQEQRDSRRQIVEERLRQQQHDRRMWAAINAPEPKPEPGIATGEGEGAYSAYKAPHPMEAITIDDAAQMSPETQRAYMMARGNREDLIRKQNEADMYLKWASANGNENRAFFIDEKGNNSHALQTVIDAGKFDRLDMSKVHSSVRKNELDSSFFIDYLSGGDPQRAEMFSRMDPALLQKTAAAQFAYEDTVKKLTPAYANPNAPESQAALAAANAPMPRAQADAALKASPRSVMAANWFKRMAALATAPEHAGDGMQNRTPETLNAIQRAITASMANQILPDGSAYWMDKTNTGSAGTVAVMSPDGRVSHMDPTFFLETYGLELPAVGDSPRGAAQTEQVQSPSGEMPTDMNDAADMFIDMARRDLEAQAGF